MGLSLEKKTEIVGLRLQKLNVPTNIIMAVKCAIDVSGSIQGMFNDGTIQETVDRMLPVGMRFDDNQSLECYAFGSGAAQLSDIKPSMFGSYINKVFLKEAENERGILWSGTSYASALELVRKDAAPSTTKKSGGFFGGLFGAKTEEVAGKANPPAYLMFLTDGDTQDEGQTEEHLKKMASESIYVQFIGVGRGSSFRFLQKMADKYDHVGFVTFPDLKNTSDQAMYNEMLSEELATWIKSQ